MALHRLTSVTLGVPSVGASSTFLTDFGLQPSESNWFRTRDGGDQLELVPARHRELKRLGVGASSPADLAHIATRVETVGLGSIIEATEAQLLIVEPVTGVIVDITVAPPIAAALPAYALNTPGRTERLDVPATSVLAAEAALPSNLTHVVYGTPDQPTTLRFFTEVIGFEISDEITGIIAFTRCGPLHHNLAIQAAPVPLIHHIAFEIDGIDDVIRRGQHMVDIDPERHTWGVGRHAIGSNWFWYLRDPSGVFFEYATDIDRISTQSAYRPKEWAPHEALYSYGPPVNPDFLTPPDLAELIAASA